MSESTTSFGDFTTGAQYPDPPKDGIERFCRRCAPAAERMFVELAARVSWPVVLLALNRLLAEWYAAHAQRYVVGWVGDPMMQPLRQHDRYPERGA